jgi:hypothetical protein
MASDAPIIISYKPGQLLRLISGQGLAPFHEYAVVAEQIEVKQYLVWRLKAQGLWTLVQGASDPQNDVELRLSNVIHSYGRATAIDGAQLQNDLARIQRDNDLRSQQAATEAIESRMAILRFIAACTK